MKNFKLVPCLVISLLCGCVYSTYLNKNVKSKFYDWFRLESDSNFKFSPEELF